MSRRHSRGSMQSSTLHVDRILAKESNYREGISSCQTSCKFAADQIKKDSDLEKALKSAVNEENQQEAILNSIQEQRDRLKQISQKNVENCRQVNAFIGALQQIKMQIPNQNADEEVDYEAEIKKQMYIYKENAASTLLDFKDEQYCREVLSALGESAARKGSDEDEELEVVGNASASGQSLKCPIMGALFVEPMKSKVCGHVYSKEGIMTTLRIRGGRIACPVAGCSNGSLTAAQLERDVETEHKVKRQRRREEKERQHRATQDLIDSDEEEM